MKLPLAGGCQCGHLRYAITAEPLTLYACHCHECQHQSGSAFGMSLFVPAAAIEHVGATPASFRCLTPNNRMQTRIFCDRCGTRLLHLPDTNTAIAALKAGTLDDTSWLDPVAHIWLSSRQPWVVIPEGVIRYDGQPTDFPGLFEAWRQRMAGLSLGAAAPT